MSSELFYVGSFHSFGSVVGAAEILGVLLNSNNICTMSMLLSLERLFLNCFALLYLSSLRSAFIRSPSLNMQGT